MKEEHEEFTFARKLNGDMNRENLTVYVENEIQKPVRGSKFGGRTGSLKFHPNLVKVSPFN